MLLPSEFPSAFYSPLDRSRPGTTHRCTPAGRHARNGNNKSAILREPAGVGLAAGLFKPFTAHCGVGLDYYPHPTDGETEAQHRLSFFPFANDFLQVLNSMLVAEVGTEPRSPDSSALLDHSLHRHKNVKIRPPRNLLSLKALVQ